MTNYEYIMTQCRRFRYSKWDETELRRCKELLRMLSREELLNVYRSRFLIAKHPLRDATFKVLFADKLGKREERIHTMPVEDLIAEFQNKNSMSTENDLKKPSKKYKTTFVSDCISINSS